MEMGLVDITDNWTAFLNELYEMRSVTNLPIDLYVEAPDGLGGVVRGMRSRT